MNIMQADMTVTLLLLVLWGGYALGGAAPSPERGYQLNDTSAEIHDNEREISSLSSNNIQITSNSSHDEEDTADQRGPPDSHEAMNNRDSTGRREKRSFEFLVGLINNNSKYEVIRSDPELRNAERGVLRAEDDGATKLLLDLLAKIVTYPEQWNQIHQVLRNLDQDLSSSQQLMRYHQQQRQRNYAGSKRRTQQNDMHPGEAIQETTTNKWPNFDELKDDNAVASSVKPETKTGEKVAYQNKNLFAYHKVTGKPAHLKKTPTAYIAVSAVAPKSSSESEDEYLLETELHQLKPWKNKQPSSNRL